MAVSTPQRGSEDEQPVREGHLVYENLRGRIVDGILTPGTRLVEGTLAKEFGLSRSPVREALSRLVYEGLCERQDRAVRVRVLRAEDVLEVYEVRIALESAAARIAAERRVELDLRRLQRSVEEMQALDPRDLDQRPKLANGFHFLIWDASHNSFLMETLKTVHLRVASLSSTTLHYPERWAVFTDECDKIYSAIRDRDSEMARKIAELQMINARDFRIMLYSAT